MALLDLIGTEDPTEIDLNDGGDPSVIDLNEGRGNNELVISFGDDLGELGLGTDTTNPDEIDLFLLGSVYRGPSAYDVAVRNGFVGTEPEWLASLVGPESPNAAEARDAQARAEDAAERAEAATLVTAEHEETAAGHATAASQSRAQSAAYADDARQEAEASLTHRTGAETANTSAQGYSETSAQAAQTATEMRAQAEQIQGVVANLEEQAFGHAASAVEARDSAHVAADEATTQATAAREAHILAEAAREDSAAHAAAGLTSRNEAESFAGQTEARAAAAQSSRLAAEAALQNTNQAATAVAEDRIYIDARVTETSETAEVVEAHRIVAETSAGAAEVSAYNAALSEDNADGSRVAAEAARTVAVQKATEAGQAADLAVTAKEEAEAFADEAGVIYGAVATRMTNVEGDLKLEKILSMPSDFQRAGVIWSQTWSGSPTTRPTLDNGGAVYSFPDIAGAGRVAQIKVNGVNTDIAAVGTMVVQATKRYRIQTQIRSIAPLLGTQTATLYLIGLDKDYTAVTTPGSVNVTFTATWQTVKFEYTAEQLWALNGNVAYLRPMVRFNGNGSNNTVQVQYILIEEVSELVTVDGRVTTEEGVRLAADNVLATRQSLTEANMNRSSLREITQNPNLSNTAFNSPAAPAGFYNITNAALTSRVAGKIGAYAWRFAAPAATEIRSGNDSPTNFPSPGGPGAYVLEVVAELVSGSWKHSEVDLQIYTAGFVTLRKQVNLGLGVGIADGETTASTDGVVGKLTTFSIFFDLPAGATTDRWQLGIRNGFARYFSGPTVACTVDFHRIAIRPATPTEIEVRAARGASASLSARTTAIDQARIDGDSALSLRASAVEARSSAGNLLRRAFWPATSGLIDYAPWTYTGNISGGGAGVWTANNSWAPPAERPLFSRPAPTGAAVSQYIDFLSELVPVEQDKRYCAQALNGVHTASIYGQIFIYCYGATENLLGALIDYTTSVNTTANSGPSLSNYKRVYKFTDQISTLYGGQVRFIRVALRMQMQTATTDNNHHCMWLRPMLSEASALQTIPPPWVDAMTEARVVAEEQASADLYGRTRARWANGTAVPGASTFIYAQSESTPGAAPTSDVGIGAKTISMFNESGGVWTKALEIANGNAVFTGGLRAGAFVRLGNGQGWPLALKNVDFPASDGQAVSFNTTLETLPAVIPLMDNLLPLSAGETYDIRPSGLTGSGFTMVARINVPGTETSYTRTASAYDNTIAAGAIKISKSADPNSKDGKYAIQCYGYNHHNFMGTGSGGGGPIIVDPEASQDFSSGEIRIHVKKAGVWSIAIQQFVFSSISTSDYPSGSMQNASGIWTFSEIVNLGDNVQEVAISYVGPNAWAYVAAFQSLGWISQAASSSSRSALSSGAKTTMSVRPQ